MGQSWYLGLAAGGALALWIWLYVQPSNMLIGGWIGTVVGAFYVTARVTREVLYGIARVRGEVGGEVAGEGAGEVTGEGATLDRP